MNKKKIDVLKEKIETKETQEANKFLCSLREFKTTSEHGLKSHETRKHSKFTTDIFPKQCDLCQKVFKSKEDMEEHMFTHSYTGKENLQFKCNECVFWCPNKKTIEDHIKKFH